VTGAVEKVFVSPAGFGSTTASLGLAHLGQPQNVSASAVVRFVYGGDLQGNVWRVDLDAANGSSLVRVAAATAPNGTAQPIAVRPVVAPVVGTATSFFLYFGTGQYFSAEDVPGTATPNAFATQVQTIYGIVDDASVASPPLPNLRGSNGSTCPSNGGNGALVCQSATATGDAIAVSHNQVNLSSRRGFYLDLPLRGQRVVVPITLTAGGTLVVPVNVPASTTCNPGGSSGEFSLSALNGGAVAVTYGGSEYYAAYQVIGDALTSGAIALESPRGRKAVVHLSDGTTRVFDIPETRGLNPAFRRIYMRPLN
jgi:type IV pilus assembly protein PilY1